MNRTATIKNTSQADVQPSLHRKLRIGSPDSRLERQADAVADQVMRMPEPTVQRKCARCEEDEKKLQRKENGALNSPSVAPPIVHNVLAGSGRPLDPAARSFMEPRFGRDFADVRIHTGGRAAESADAVNALAYTVGRDVVFAEGQYRPETEAGRSLIAHELGHVMQGMEGESLPRFALSRTADSTLMRATRTFSLTFDDGPHTASLNKGSNRTEMILDTLKAKNVKAGFFIQTHAQDAEGNRMRGNTTIGKQLIVRMKREGHTIGIHTGGTVDHQSHPDAAKAGKLEGELNQARDFIAGVTGDKKEDVVYVRPPYGDSNAEVRTIYNKVGLTNLLWDIDGDKEGEMSLDKLKARLESSDSKDPGIPAIRSRDWKGTTPVSPKIVILYHDTRKNTATHIGEIIDHIRKVTKAMSNNEDTADFAAP